MTFRDPYIGAAKAILVVSLALSLFWAGHHFGAQGVQAKWDKANADRLAADNAAIMSRMRNNERIAEQQDIDNQRITKAHNDELAQVRTNLARSERLRVGSALCGGSSSPAETKSASGGNGADSGGRVLSPEMDRDIKTLIEETERATAAGRAAQAFIRANGLALQK